MVGVVVPDFVMPDFVAGDFVVRYFVVRQVAKEPEVGDIHSDCYSATRLEKNVCASPVLFLQSEQLLANCRMRLLK